MAALRHEQTTAPSTAPLVGSLLQAQGSSQELLSVCLKLSLLTAVGSVEAVGGQN